MTAKTLHAAMATMANENRLSLTMDFLCTKRLVHKGSRVDRLERDVDQLKGDIAAIRTDIKMILDRLPPQVSTAATSFVAVGPAVSVSAAAPPAVLAAAPPAVSAAAPPAVSAMAPPAALATAPPALLAAAPPALSTAAPLSAAVGPAESLLSALVPAEAQTVMSTGAADLGDGDSFDEEMPVSPEGNQPRLGSTSKKRKRGVSSSSPDKTPARLPSGRNLKYRTGQL